MEVLKVQKKQLIEKAIFLNSEFIERFKEERSKLNFWKELDITSIPELDIIKSFVVTDEGEIVQYYISLQQPINNICRPLGSYLIQHGPHRFSLLSEAEFFKNYNILGE